MTIATRTVTGKLTAGGQPAQGFVRFRPSIPEIIDTASNAIITDAWWYADLDGTGAFSIALPVNDSPDQDSSGRGFSWTVELYPVPSSVPVPATPAGGKPWYSVVNQGVVDRARQWSKTWSFLLPSGSSVDLADLTPVTPVGQVYATLADFQQAISDANAAKQSAADSAAAAQAAQAAAQSASGMPAGGSTGNVLTKTASGTSWTDISGTYDRAGMAAALSLVFGG